MRSRLGGRFLFLITAGHSPFSGAIHPARATNGPDERPGECQLGSTNMDRLQAKAETVARRDDSDQDSEPRRETSRWRQVVSPPLSGRAVPARH
jgi:hypothetical protein